ncbi:unnamed protein product [Discosporangium mesarthrocarpum]
MFGPLGVTVAVAPGAIVAPEPLLPVAPFPTSRGGMSRRVSSPALPTNLIRLPPGNGTGNSGAMGGSSERRALRVYHLGVFLVTLKTGLSGGGATISRMLLWRAQSADDDEPRKGSSGVNGSDNRRWCLSACGRGEEKEEGVPALGCCLPTGRLDTRGEGGVPVPVGHSLALEVGDDLFLVGAPPSFAHTAFSPEPSPLGPSWRLEPFAPHSSTDL